MTSKEELKQYKYAKSRVEETLEEYEKYKTRAEKITSVLSDMPRGQHQNTSKVEENAVIMADISKQYEERWIKAEREKLKLERDIDKVDEPYRTLLHKKYIEELSLEKIACDMNYTYDTIRHMHGEALLKYGRKS